jgi:antitoxin ParD1/3/4
VTYERLLHIYFRISIYEIYLRLALNTKFWYTVLPFAGNKDQHAMSKNTSFSLSGHFSDFVEKQIVSGRYGSASDVIRAGLRLLEDHEVKLEALRAALIEGEESGEPMRIDVEDFVSSHRKGDLSKAVG